MLPLTGRATAGDFARRAHAEIDALVAAGRRPIVVGGTGLYLRAALADLDLRPPPDPAVRERYARRIADEGVRALHADLLARNPEVAARIAATDAQRVARALELLDAGETPSAGDQLWTAHTRHPTLLVALTMERTALYARIDARVDAMVAAGAEDEVRRADAAGASPSARQALGFAELLAGDVPAMKQRTRRYAKRQLTWLRKLPGTLDRRPDRPQRSGRRGGGPLRPARGRGQQLGADEARERPDERPVGAEAQLRAAVGAPDPDLGDDLRPVRMRQHLVAHRDLAEPGLVPGAVGVRAVEAHERVTERPQLPGQARDADPALLGEQRERVRGQHVAQRRVAAAARSGRAARR